MKSEIILRTDPVLLFLTWGLLKYFWDSGLKSFSSFVFDSLSSPVEDDFLSSLISPTSSVLFLQQKQQTITTINTITPATTPITIGTIFVELYAGMFVELFVGEEELSITKAVWYPESLLDIIEKPLLSEPPDEKVLKKS